MDPEVAGPAVVGGEVGLHDVTLRDFVIEAATARGLPSDPKPTADVGLDLCMRRGMLLTAAHGRPWSRYELTSEPGKTSTLTTIDPRLGRVSGVAIGLDSSAPGRGTGPTGP
jgi:hypothetical protein